MAWIGVSAASVGTILGFIAQGADIIWFAAVPGAALIGVATMWQQVVEGRRFEDSIRSRKPPPPQRRPDEPPSRAIHDLPLMPTKVWGAYEAGHFTFTSHYFEARLRRKSFKLNWSEIDYAKFENDEDHPRLGLFISYRRPERSGEPGTAWICDANEFGWWRWRKVSRQFLKYTDRRIHLLVPPISWWWRHRLPFITPKDTS